MNAGVKILGKDFGYKSYDITDCGTYFDYRGEHNYKNLFIPLLGKHQVENSTLAIAAVAEFEKFDEKKIRIGLKNAFIPGRLEIIQKNPLVVLDGAHNPDKMHALVSSVKAIWPDKKMTVILAIKEDKNAEEMIKIILPICKEIILTSFESLLDLGKVLSLDPVKLKETVKRLNFQGRIIIEEDSNKVIKTMKNYVRKEDIILVTGSLYLVGIIRKYLYEK